jgi:uncharacterized caspase-like protein
MKAPGALVSAVLLLAAGLAAAQAPKPQRIALVIGNAKYADAPLPNAANDAQDMARELEAAGFKVIARRDATLKDMRLALREFGDALGKSSTGVFYYAGHGLQVRGRNYLVPVDADVAREDEVAFSALDLAAVMEKLDTARNPVNVVILDACRNNPFSKRFTVAAGLAQVEAPPGTLIAFSTAPGSVAADGTGRNGLYTRHLLEQMKRPGAPVEETFKSVRAAVRKESAGRQVPWESTSLETQFAFHAAAAPKPRAEAAAPAKTASAGQRSATRGAVAASTPPAYAPGDTWTYRVRNLIDQSERTVTMTVRQVKGNEVHWNADQVSDLMGNFTRVKRGDTWRTYSPASQMYTFPMSPGATSTIKVHETVGNKKGYDLEIRLGVVREEEIATPAGRFRAVKLDRVVAWKERDKAYRGENTWTLWYSGEAKRFIVAEQTNRTADGKTLASERWELESYRVR